MLDILSIADPPPVDVSPPDWPLLSPLVPEIPFLLICYLENKSLIKSPPPDVGAATASFSAFFFNFRSFALLSLTLPAPPAALIDSIKLERPSDVTALGTPLGVADPIMSRTNRFSYFNSY